MTDMNSNPEPTFAEACTWWSDLPNIWTPLGWKAHLFRYHVLWNGTIHAQPHLNRRTEPWQGQGVQMAVAPQNCRRVTKRPFFEQDNNLFDQGWEDGDAPVLWTDLPKDGTTLRQSVFAHVAGGKAVVRGDEPLFAWVRLQIQDICEGLPMEKDLIVHVRLNAPHIGGLMEARHNIVVRPEQAAYPRTLTWEAEAYDAARGLRLLEPDGRVRFAVAPGQTCEFVPFEQTPDGMHLDFGLALPMRRGASVDLLLPMLPTERETFDSELASGYNRVRTQTARFWAPRPASAARIELPERPLVAATEHSLRLAQMLFETVPATGKLCMINGSFTYANLWTTPGALTGVMLIDMMGHHALMGRYLEIFREEQGTVTPPGGAYGPHPGYLSTPANYKSIDWLADHGAVLYTLAMHGLLSGDAAFIERFTPTIERACDFIQHARAMRGHGGVPGLLPPAVATDRRTEIQGIWNDGWNHKGLACAVRLLRQIGHPRAAEFAAELADHREVFAKAYRAACRKAPMWTGPDGRRRPLPPTSLAGDAPDETRHAFYLDTGPLFLVFSGLLDADDAAMESIRTWFREGPPRRFYRMDSSPWIVPSLQHEMSSCEPCYSWNVFHSWRQGDRRHFLEGMYSLFAGSLSRKTWISCETRGGITGTLFSAPLALYLARLAVIDDEIAEDELHLLRLMPLAWLKPGDTTRFERMPTVFGPVTLATTLAADGRTLAVDFEPAFRIVPRRVLLHAPPLPGLEAIHVNGAAVPLRDGKAVLSQG